MIKKITIRDVASYDAEGVVLDDLQKVNIIYGGNGTGKTTIGRILGSQNRWKEYPDCEVERDGEELPVLVYNKYFRDKNFQENIPGVFTIGEDAVDAIKELENLREKEEEQARALRDISYRKREAQQAIEAAQKSLLEIIWSRTRKRREELKNCMDAGMTKKDFARKLAEKVKEGFEKKEMHAKDLRRRYATLYSEGEPKVIDLVKMPTEAFEQAKELTESEVWKERAWGGDQIQIGNLVKELKMEDWVKKGLELVDRHKLEICPFCQKHTIDGFFRHQMNDYFSEHYWQHIEALKTMKEQYESAASVIMVTLKEILNRMDLNEEAESALNRELFEAELEMLKDRLVYNIDFMEAKLKEPETTAGFKTLSNIENKLKELTDAVNAKISEHNGMVENLAEERKKLKDDVWQYLAKQTESDIKNLERVIRKNSRKLNQLTDEERPLEIEHKQTENDIRTKEDNLCSAQPTIDRINKALLQFGFTGFSIQPSAKHKNYYQIQREDGKLAHNTLSEGEVTFITFLYYLQLVKGFESKEVDMKPRILVIDDPISSLDGNVLFVVSTMVRRLINEVRNSHGRIEQVFVLTHNVYFHKEVSYINIRANKRKDTHHWLLYKQGNTSKVYSYGMENPIIGSYDLLWKELRDHQNDLGGMDNITLQNTMRRIIETYFVTFGGQKKNALIPENFGDDPDELVIAASFARWFDEGSHDILDDFYVEHPREMNEKYLAMFRKLFERSGHLAHYNMMMAEHQHE